MRIENGRKLQISCIAAGILWCLTAAWMSNREARIPGGYLERGDYGAEPVVYELVLEEADGQTLDCRMEIRAQQYDAEAAEKVFTILEDQLPELILGNNESLEEIRSDLNLPREFESYGVRVKWFSSEPEVADSDGKILAEGCPEEGIPVQLTAELTAGTYTRVSTVTIRVCPARLTEEEILRQEIQQLLAAAEADAPEGKTVVLPVEYRGRTIRFSHKQNRDYLWFPLLGILAAGLLYMKEKDDVEKAIKLRSQKLLLEYADVVYQFMIYIGAGLTVVRAWEQIVKHYESRRAAGHYGERPAYEEMTAAYGKMQCGMSEGKAIDEFGRSCNLP